jgi:hypothetical protein
VRVHLGGLPAEGQRVGGTAGQARHPAAVCQIPGGVAGVAAPFADRQSLGEAAIGGVPAAGRYVRERRLADTPLQEEQVTGAADQGLHLF